MMVESFEILGVRISAINLKKADEIIDSFIKEKKRCYVCVAPISTVMECQDDPEYKKVINNADLVTPDGMPVVWLGRLRGQRDVRRTYGPDVMLRLCNQGQERGYRHYFYGATPQVCQRLILKLKERFPKINIAGNYSPPMMGTYSSEKENILDRINESKPDILWVGLGAPKQDFWVARHREKLGVPVMIGIGAAFDFLSGSKKQAPVWMQKSGLEWFFRLLCEPKRLWKRYLIGNSRFIWLLLKDCFKKGIR